MGSWLRGLTRTVLPSGRGGRAVAGLSLAVLLSVPVAYLLWSGTEEASGDLIGLSQGVTGSYRVGEFVVAG